MRRNKWGFGEYLRDICEAAKGDCLNCRITGLPTFNHDITEGKPLCQVLERLLTHTSTDQLLRFVKEVTDYADEADKAEEPPK